MAQQIDYATLTRMLQAAAERIRRARDTLAALDAATGDGDHGAAMCKIADAIDQTIVNREDRDMGAMLSDVGWAAMGTDAGSAGPLYGSMFVGMGAAVADGPLDASGIAGLVESGTAQVRTQSKAGRGDKTMLDALIPACEAIRAAANAGASLGAALAAGADAALQGAEATAGMQARFGRARNLGQRSIGHQDPGAVSMSLLFVGLKEGLSNAGS
jgi:dihydroxyacetone kinase-like protein